ncbi:MAG: hypothetical protein IPL83_02500 [Bdellovibrionales bacterium]|nr:hypothetical protein [Bdellovibrionales bacterium]
MQKGKEIRFTTFIDEHTECEVFATIENGGPVIQTVNIVGDCVVTFDDLDDEGREFLMSEVRRVMAESHKS